VEPGVSQYRVVNKKIPVAVRKQTLAIMHVVTLLTELFQLIMKNIN